MTLEDVPTVAELDRISFSLPWPERSFRFEVTENDCSRCWVAEADGQIVGMLVLWLIMDEAHIATIAVHPDYRQRGIGAHILRETLKAAKAEGAGRATLEVRVGNLAAQEMYRKFGFEVVGSRPHYYKDNNEDAILLTLQNLNHLE
jgi:ribosomal-protein-alanine N-acetyltransferase